MKILVLCKRRYTGKDLLNDRYGRLYELPKALAFLGHRVAGLALSYRIGRETDDPSPVCGDVDWLAASALPWPPAYLRQLQALQRGFSPDVIWASSDALHAILAQHISSQWGIPLVIDLYDDYEAFGLTRLPGVIKRYRGACSRANALTVVTHSLGTTVTSRLADAVPIHVIGNGVVPEFFHLRPRAEARARFDLPQGAVLIGSAGALDSSRGIVDLLEAFQLLRLVRKDAYLVLAGPRDIAMDIKGAEGIIDLGILPHGEIPLLLSALDVGVVCNRDSLFGRACYPMKLAEMIACGVPIVAAAIGDMPRILGDRQQCLYSPGNTKQLMQRILSQVLEPAHANPGAVATWDQLGQALSTVLENVVEKQS